MTKRAKSDTQLIQNIKNHVTQLAVMIEEARQRRINVNFDIRMNERGRFSVRQLEITRMPELL